MKKKKIVGINFLVSENKTGLVFEFDKKEDLKSGLKIGANSIVKSIQKELDKIFGKDEFFYKGGKPIESGIEFRLQPKQSLLDKL